MKNQLKSLVLATLVLPLLGAVSLADQNTSLVSQLGVGASTCTETLDKEGNLVAVARRHDGCALIDVSDPQNPLPIGTIHPDVGATYDIWDVDLHNGYLYLMNRPEAVDSQLLNWVGVYIYDLNVVGPPPQVGYILWGGGAWHHLAGSVKSGTVAEVNGSPYAFLCSDITGDVEVFDMSLPSAPLYVTSILAPQIFSSSWDVRVQNDHLFTAWGRGGFTIHDVSVIGAPLLTRHQVYTGPATINGGVRTIAPTPDGTRVVTGEYTLSGHVRLWDVSPIGPPLSWQLGSGALLWTVRTTNDFVYVAHLEDGIQVLDIRTPNQMTSVGCFDPSTGNPTGTWAGISDVEIVGTRLYASHQTDGLYVVDFGDEVVITKAEWRRRKKELTVWAESSGQPDVSLEVVGFGQMNWNRKRGRYELKVRNVASNPVTVGVVSDLTGAAIRTVTVRN